MIVVVWEGGVGSEGGAKAVCCATIDSAGGRARLCTAVPW